MKKAFQKALALSLALMLLLSLAATAAAKDTTQWISQSHSDIPVIRISGDGEKLVDEDGNKVFHYKDIASVLKKDDDDDGDNRILEAIANILKPFLLDGVLKNDWDPYYENLQKEISDLFSHSLLDNDGNPQYGTGLRPERMEKVEKIRHNDQA